LSNGLRVATEETYGQTCSMGLFINAGSRYENDHNAGISHVLEHCAFKSTENRSHLRLVRDVEDMGGYISAHCEREHMMYSANVLRPFTSSVLEIVAETVLRPKIEQWDLEETRKVIGFELQSLETNAQALVTESLHAAAFGDGSALGRTTWCPARNLNKIGSDEIKSFTDTYFSAPRMVLAAAGADHDEFVALAEKYFSDLPSEDKAPPAELCTYTGGDRRLRGESELTHLSLCFDGGGWKSQDLLATCVLHMLLGGGGSFSAGGPGKGMYSRLYLSVLNQFGWVDSATAFNAMYDEAGLIGIYGTCKPSDAGKLTEVFVEQMLKLASSPATEEETSRAKNQLKSSIMMNLESRQILCEDIGRQMLTYGHREDAASMCARIDAISATDVMNVAKKAVSSAPTFAAFGDVSTIPSYETIATKFA